jgi:hypothetical protein
MNVSDTPSPVPIFSFANGEGGAISRRIIRGLECVTGQPRIKKIYLDYVDDNRPDHLFWQDAVGRLNLNVDLNFDPGHISPPKAVCWLLPIIRSGLLMGWFYVLSYPRYGQIIK